MAADDYIDISFDIFEYEGQHARVKRSLTIEMIINEVLREFDDIPADPQNKYVIYMKGDNTPLQEQKNLVQLDIQPQDELVFDHFRRFLRKNLSPETIVSFIEVKSGESFNVEWQPALIGRASQEMDHNILLAVDLDFLPEGKTVSRSHAEFTFENGLYYIRPMAAHNPVFLNGQKMQYNKRFEIKHRDEITLGYQDVTLFFRTQSNSKKSIKVESKEKVMVTNQVTSEEPSATLIDGSAVSMKISTPFLVIEAAADQSILGETIQVVTYPFLLGRTHPMLNNEDQASRRHAQITKGDGGKYFITDLGSTNGTMVNGVTITPNLPVEIMKGSRIRLGNVLTMRLES